MVPPAELLPDTLPTERLTSAGRPVPRVRDDRRHIPDGRNAVTVLSLYAQTLTVLIAAVWINHPIGYAAAFLLMGRAHCQYNILRAIAEHGGMVGSDDRRLTTHVVRQSLMARFWLVPYHTGWHLAHHVDPGIPWRNLPKLHRELVASGWVVEGLVYPNYPALWRALRSG